MKGLVYRKYGGTIRGIHEFSLLIGREYDKYAICKIHACIRDLCMSIKLDFPCRASLHEIHVMVSCLISLLLLIFCTIASSKEHIDVMLHITNSIRVTMHFHKLVSHGGSHTNILGFTLMGLDVIQGVKMGLAKQ